MYMRCIHRLAKQNGEFLRQGDLSTNLDRFGKLLMTTPGVHDVMKFRSAIKPSAPTLSSVEVVRVALVQVTVCSRHDCILDVHRLQV